MRKMSKKVLSLALACLMGFFLLAGSTGGAQAAGAAPTIKTTLSDGATQKGSRKTFDVWARDASGKKIASTVTLNGEAVPYTWDDTDKTSYTLHFTREGANTVVVSASAGGKTATKTYRLQYQKASPGDVIGKATWSVEVFTIGCGYLIEPVKREIKEGENAAQGLLRLLQDYGYTAFYGGSDQAAFYLAYIADGTNIRKNFNGYSNMIHTYGAPKSPQELNLSPAIPPVLYPHLTESMNYFDDQDYQNWTGTIGEFVFTNGSGWMYSVNNVFPNVGFSDSYLSDGDVVRVQLTLGYGADIGGASAMGGAIPGNDTDVSNFFAVGNKDRLTALVAQAKTNLEKSGVKEAYSAAVSRLQVLNATQRELDQAYTDLLNAMQATSSSSSDSSPSSEKTSSVNSGAVGGESSGSVQTSTQGASSAGEEGSSSAGSAEEPLSSRADSPQTEASQESGSSGMGEEAGSRVEPGSENAPENPEVGGTPAWYWWMTGAIVVLAAAGTLLLLYTKKKKLLFWKE